MASRRWRLIVFGRLPEAGRVKTRLGPELSPTTGAALYEAFLDDTMALAPPGVETELWVPERPRALQRLAARYPAARIRLQPEGSLGHRLRAAFACAFSGGVVRAVALGSDHPTLPARYVERAFDELGRAPLTLGPTRDGGYYAIGLSAQPPQRGWPAGRALLDGAPWSTPELHSWTLERAASAGLDCRHLPLWYDVDRPSDLRRMEGDLREGSATARVWSRLRGAASTTAASAHVLGPVATTPPSGPDGGGSGAEGK